MTPRHFLEVDDLSGAELRQVLELADATEYPRVLDGRSVALVFEKPSLRTRNSSEVAVVQLGGHPLTMFRDEVGLGLREPVGDVARVLSRYHALLGARVFGHDLVAGLAASASVPVVNLLSDESHPCQALADLLTIAQHLGGLDGAEVAYVGDFNNVARSLALGCALAGARLRLACPPGYGPGETDLERIRRAGGAPLITERPHDAVEKADVVYTDVWTSMGQEAEAEARWRAFEGFQVDESMMERASADAIFLHCLPAHRGEEVSAGVVDGERSLVWQQAENRLHAFRGLLLFLLGSR